MFLANYNHLHNRRSDLYHIAFLIPGSKYTLCRDTSDYIQCKNFYHCDDEFLTFLTTKICPSVINSLRNKQEDRLTFQLIKLFFITEDLDENFAFLLRSYNDILTAFKIYLDDEKLDKLCKD